jgi:hypothetical protein
MYVYYVLCICYIGGIRILERLSWGMAQKRLGNTGLKDTWIRIASEVIVSPKVAQSNFRGCEPMPQTNKRLFTKKKWKWSCEY